jgi:cytosine/adenosine deaminase-related metal-dependent hydrolase
MIRDRLRRLAGEALHRMEEERDASQLRIYTAPWVLTGEGAPIREGALVLDAEGRVMDCGPAVDLVPRFRWAQRADLGGMILPGFVDAHARLELGGQSVPARERGLRGRLRVLRDLHTASDQLDADSREARIRASVRGSVDAGTAAVGDVTSSLRAVRSMSREGLYGVVFHEIEGFSKRKAARALAAAAAQRAGIVPWPDGINYRLAPHSLYSTAGHVVRDLLGKALEKGAVTAIRLAEAEDERDLLEFGGDAARHVADAIGGLLDDFAAPGLDPLAYLDELGGLHSGVMLLHMTTASRDLVRRASRAGAPLVLTPRADLGQTGALPPLVSFLAEGCRVALGTAAGADRPSVLREAAELHAAFPEVPSLVLFNAATGGGADALGLDSIGLLEPGRAPGVLHVDTGSRTPDDPCGWLLRAGTPDLQWLARPAPPAAA